METLNATIVNAEKSCKAISTKKNEPPQKMDKTTSISHSLVAIAVCMFDVIKKQLPVKVCSGFFYFNWHNRGPFVI